MSWDSPNPTAASNGILPNAISAAHTLTITPGAITSLTLSPASAVGPIGGSITYQAVGADTYGNTLGDVTANITFSIAPDGHCTGPTCTGTMTAGLHTITAIDGAATATATLTITRTGTAITTDVSAASVWFGTSDTFRFRNLPSGATGSVSFTNTTTGSILCTVPDVTAASSCPTSASLPAGTYPVTATYSGDSNYQPSNATTTFQIHLTAIQAATNLGAAASFSGLAGAAVTTSGSAVSGNFGAGAASTISATAVGGTVQSPANTAAALAIATAYTALKALTPTGALAGDDLGGQRITPGVYHRTAALAMPPPPVTFDAKGDPNAIFVIQSDAPLNTTAGSFMILTGGAKASNIYWVTTGAATLGASSTFEGNILANAAITVGAASTIVGRAISITAAITLDATTITNN